MCSTIMKDKYMFGYSFTSWVGMGAKKRIQSSYIWGSLHIVLALLMGQVRWSMGDGSKVQIGLDSIVCFYRNHTLYVHLLNHLQSMQIVHINHVFCNRVQNLNGQEWMSAEDLGLTGVHGTEWLEYVMDLRQG